MANESTNKRKILYAIGAAVVVIAAIAAYFGGALYGTFATDKEEHIIYIAEGESPDSVKAKVESVADASKFQTFQKLAERKGYYDNIRPGRYDIGSGTSTLSVFRNLRNGNQAPVKLTIPPLHTVDQLARHLGKKLMCDSAEYAKALKDSTLLAKYGLKRETAICLFMQNTYEVYWTSNGEKLLDRMYKEYQNYWNKSRLAKLDEITKGFTREQAITLASIIERETNNKAEKPTIAGLYINRLHKGMKLQACPTVIFAVGDFTMRRVLNRHLETDSPYNTYKYEGLPPGPIYIPSPESLDAVLNYDHTDYLFMCAKEDFSGTHNFASTGAEHEQNAQRYQKALNERGLKK